MCWRSTRQIHRSSAPLILLIFLGCGLSCPSKRTAYIIRVRAILSLELLFRVFSTCIIIRVRTLYPSNRFIRPSTPPYYSSAGIIVPRIAYRTNSASELFECGLRSLEWFSLGQQHLYFIRGRASVPRMVFFGPAAPLLYSRAGFGPSNGFLRASSASTLFDCRLRSLESSSSGQQRLQITRVWASVSRIVFIGPTVPPNYLSVGFCPSSYSLWASSAFTLFECGLWSLELFSSGQQHLYIIRVWVRPLESHLLAISALILFGYGPLSFESLFCAINAFKLPGIW
jgi:hypothetical protein